MKTTDDDIEICAITLAIALNRIPNSSPILREYMCTNDIAIFVNHGLPNDIKICATRLQISLRLFKKFIRRDSGVHGTLNLTKHKYDIVPSYGTIKSSNLMFTLRLTNSLYEGNIRKLMGFIFLFKDTILNFCNYCSGRFKKIEEIYNAGLWLSSGKNHLKELREGQEYQPAHLQIETPIIVSAGTYKKRSLAL